MTMIGRDPERDRLLEGDQEQLHGRDASRPVGGSERRSRVRWPGPPATVVNEANHRRDPIRSTRAFRRAPRLVGRRRLGRPARRRHPVRPAGAGQAERRRVHPRRPRIGPGQGAPRDRRSARRRRRSSSSSRARPSRRARPRSRPPRPTRSATSRPPRTSRASCRTCSRRARSRPTGTPPTTSSSSTCRPTIRRSPADPPRAPARRAGPDGRAGRRAGLLRRRPDGLRGRPAPERAHLAAAGGARARLRLRLAGRGRASRWWSVARR